MDRCEHSSPRASRWINCRAGNPHTPVYSCDVWGECVFQSNKLTGTLTSCETCPNHTSRVHVDLTGVFERVYCINLDRRADRWEQFQKQLENWPFRDIERWTAVDGQTVEVPPWFPAGQGAWGCRESHLQIIRKCLDDNVRSVLILEDDAQLSGAFNALSKQFFEQLPDDWGMVYLGGQHWKQGQQNPEKINDWVYRCFNVNRTHAYGLQGETMQAVYEHITDIASWDTKREHHIDHHLGRFHEKQFVEKVHNVYCPRAWLIGQRAGQSNILGKVTPTQFWKAAKDIPKPKPRGTLRVDERIIAVMGLYRGGTSVTAGVLHRLGVNMGNNLKSCKQYDNYEAKPLWKACVSCYGEPHLNPKRNFMQRVSAIQQWLNLRRQQNGPLQKGRLAIGAKHPLLAYMGEELVQAAGESPLTIVNVVRPLEESQESLQRARWWPKYGSEMLQRIWDAREKFLAETDAEVITVQFDDLKRDPEKTVAELVEQLKLNVDTDTMRHAAALVKVNETAAN